MLDLVPHLSPGDWYVGRRGNRVVCDNGEDVCMFDDGEYIFNSNSEDVAFVALARTALPALAREYLRANGGA